MNVSENRYLDQRSIDAQNWGAAQYLAHQARIRAEGNAVVLSFAIFVVGVLALAAVLALAFMS